MFLKFNTYVYIYINIHACMHIYVFTYIIYVYVYTFVYIYTHTCVCVYVCIYIYVYATRPSRICCFRVLACQMQQTHSFFWIGCLRRQHGVSFQPYLSLYIYIYVYTHIPIYRNVYMYVSPPCSQWAVALRLKLWSEWQLWHSYRVRRRTDPLLTVFLIFLSSLIIVSTVNVVIISITIFRYCTRRHHSNAK